MEYMEIGIIGISRENQDFLIFWGLPVVREGSGEVPGAGTLHPDRIWARTEPSRPNSTRFS